VIRTYHGVRYAREVRGRGFRVVQQPMPRCKVVRAYIETRGPVTARR
jgi:hypothetical protein